MDLSEIGVILVYRQEAEKLPRQTSHRNNTLRILAVLLRKGGGRVRELKKRSINIPPPFLLKKRRRLIVYY